MHKFALLLALIAPASVLAPDQADAQPHPTGERAFDIPAQPLASAIAAYSNDAKIGVAFDADDVANRRSNAVKGSATPQAALRQLLEGTGLVARFTAADSAIIVDPRAQTPSHSTETNSPGGRLVVNLDVAVVEARRTIGHPDPKPLNDYARRAQDELQTIFTREPAFRDSDFRFRIAVLIDRAGRITSATLLRPSGKPERDRLISPLILGRNVGIPPSGLVRALTFDIIGSMPVYSARNGR